MAQGECIEYRGTRNAHGYGLLTKPVNGSRLAHRAVLAEKLGRPVSGFALHSCDNPPCINPDHLHEGDWAMNAAEAKARGRTRGGRYNQTHCIHGHELSPANTYYKPSRRTRSGYERVCWICKTNHQLAQNERAKNIRRTRKTADGAK